MCDALAEAIGFPFPPGFRRRLRNKTASQPPAPPLPPPSQPQSSVDRLAYAAPSTAWAQPMVAAPNQPPPSQAPSAAQVGAGGAGVCVQSGGSHRLLSEYVRVPTRSAVLCGERMQLASPRQPSLPCLAPQSMGGGAQVLLPMEGVVAQEAAPSLSTALTEAQEAQPDTGCSAGEQEHVAMEEVTEEQGTHTHSVPYPISEVEIEQGWDTLVNKYWLRCSGCQRWRNVPEAVRHEVSWRALPSGAAC